MKKIYKILRDDIDIVHLGGTDGELLSLDKKYFTFIPVVGEYVEVYESGENTIVVSVSDTSVSKEQNVSSYKENTLVYKVIGWISAGLSLLILPIVFGACGVIFGYLIRNKGEREHGTIMMIVSIALGILGVCFGIIVSS